jgi:signal peptidase
MGLRGTRGIEVGFVVVVLALLGGQAVGQPVLLSYVRTGSMEPTLSPGDGFVAIPSVVAGPPEQGDVVVYRAESLDGGGLTTHRVVAETDRGYITQGDANPFTDQSSGEPPVRRHQIVAVGLQIGGDLVVVPGFGTAVRTVRDTTGVVTRPVGAALGGDSRAIWVGLAVAGLVVLLFGRTDDGGRTPVSDRTHGRDRASGVAVRDVVLLAGAVVVATATASMILPLGPTEYTVVSAESDVPGVGVIPAGETETTTYRVPGGGVVPTRYYVEPASEGVSVDGGTGVVRPGETANVSVALSAPPELGSHRRFVSERRYPLVLPLPLVDALHRLHPLAPLAVIDGCLALPFLVAARLVGGRVRSRGRDGGGVTTGRLWGGRAD